jgi:hypothetical protein
MRSCDIDDDSAATTPHSACRSSKSRFVRISPPSLGARSASLSTTACWGSRNHAAVPGVIALDEVVIDPPSPREPLNACSLELVQLPGLGLLAGRVPLDDRGSSVVELLHGSGCHRNLCFSRSPGSSHRGRSALTCGVGVVLPDRTRSTSARRCSPSPMESSCTRAPRALTARCPRAASSPRPSPGPRRSNRAPPGPEVSPVRSRRPSHPSRVMPRR